MDTKIRYRVCLMAISAEDEPWKRDPELRVPYKRTERLMLGKDLRDMRKPGVLLPGEQEMSKEKNMFKCLKWKEAWNF